MLMHWTKWSVRIGLQRDASGQCQLCFRAKAGSVPHPLRWSLQHTQLVCHLWANDRKLAPLSIPSPFRAASGTLWTRVPVTSLNPSKPAFSRSLSVCDCSCQSLPALSATTCDCSRLIASPLKFWSSSYQQVPYSSIFFIVFVFRLFMSLLGVLLTHPLKCRIIPFVECSVLIIESSFWLSFLLSSLVMLHKSCHKNSHGQV